MQVVLRLLLVSGGPQSQNYGVSNLQHGLQDGSHHDEEDDAEEESSVNDLQLNEPSLNSQDQQSDTLRHAPENQMRKQLLHTLIYIQVPVKSCFEMEHCKHIWAGRSSPVHGVVIHESSVTL